MHKSVVTKLEMYPNATADTYGNVGYNIEFQNGDKGSYYGSKENPSFKVGEEKEYTKEDKVGKSGKPYVKIAGIKKDWSKFGPTAPPKELIKADVIALSVKFINKAKISVEKTDFINTIKFFNAFVFKNETDVLLRFKCLSAAIDIIDINIKGEGNEVNGTKTAITMAEELIAISLS